MIILSSDKSPEEKINILKDLILTDDENDYVEVISPSEMESLNNTIKTLREKQHSLLPTEKALLMIETTKFIQAVNDCANNFDDDDFYDALMVDGPSENKIIKLKNIIYL